MPDAGASLLFRKSRPVEILN